MINKIFCFALCAMLFALGVSAQAQQAGKLYRIGLLRYRGGPPTTSSTYMELRQGLRELGYVEGQNFVIEYRSAEGKRERRAEMAAELVRLKVDVIVASPAPPAIRALQRATRTIPIVMAGVLVDPVEAGFVVSLARPGGNITGLTNLESELHGKRLELLKEAFPRISRVAILWNPAQQKHAMKEVKAAGQALGIEIRPLVVGRRHLFSHESAFSAISRERPDGLLVATSGLTLRPGHRARIIEFTAKRRLPTIYSRSQFVDAGGLMSYGMDFQHLYRRVATYVDKILKGAKPGDLPIEQPTKFELVVNLKTAKQLGLTIPPVVLMRADKVIK
ncbi:MAG: ABC transporter substrate-binding protein [Candidatus Binatia bacterium]